jgi:hypothetical protein
MCFKIGRNKIAALRYVSCLFMRIPPKIYEAIHIFSIITIGITLANNSVWYGIYFLFYGFSDYILHFFIKRGFQRYHNKYEPSIQKSIKIFTNLIDLRLLAIEAFWFVLLLILLETKFLLIIPLFLLGQLFLLSKQGPAITIKNRPPDDPNKKRIMSVDLGLRKINLARLDIFFHLILLVMGVYYEALPLYFIFCGYKLIHHFAFAIFVNSQPYVALTHLSLASVILYINGATLFSQVLAFLALAIAIDPLMLLKKNFNTRRSDLGFARTLSRLILFRNSKS